jgi:hypothetical protein
MIVQTTATGGVTPTLTTRLTGEHSQAPQSPLSPSLLSGTNPRTGTSFIAAYIAVPNGTLQHSPQDKAQIERK